MSTIDQKAADFLAQKRIAVAGVSPTHETTANGIYRRLKTAGYTLYPVNPNAETFDDGPCYPNMQAIPEPIDGVVIVTRPEITEKIVHDCAEAGVPRVWMHRSLSFFPPSVSEAAVTFCQEHGIEVIAGACPMMYCEPVDFGHKCMRWWMKTRGQMPA